uniref:VP6 n=1 Tax=Changuinola virus TaxID=40052 RepID=W5QLY9_9REOV|nr:VP6 [Changuinola virus]
MSIAVLLVPGDLIEKIKPELVERQIQVDLVDWRSKGNKEDAAENTSTKKEPDGIGLGEKADGNQKTETSDKKGKDQDGEGSNTEAKTDVPREDPGGGGEARKGPGSTGGKDGQNAPGTTGDGGGRLVVMAEGIARKIKQKYGTDLGVHPEEGTILYLEKHVQNELGFDKELAAQQQEVYKVLQKKKRDKSVIIERVISMKKLIDLVGGQDVQEKPIAARQSGVRLVSNNIKQVPKATAYFTAPTGDIHWKEVAREAAKNGNIMAYHSEGDDIAKDLVHLIDHL